jgi:XTP/dITP diphosphohydrolase
MACNIVVATKNKKKLQEIRDLLKGMDVQVRSTADLDSPPRIIEDGSSFKENAVKKALTISRFTGELTLGEDSGLCVDALGGAPGIYSSRFSGKNKSDRQNNKKVLALLKGMPLSKRKARYVCAVALADVSGLIGVVEGRCCGVIALEPKGARGFGYDPIFLIPAYKKTFAELGEGVKHRMSHRFHALKQAKEIIKKYIESS